MSKITAAITAVHAWVPENIVTNKDLEKIVDTTDEWIVTRTGIHERRILNGEGLGVSDMAVHAVNGLLEKRGLKPEDIDCLLCATTTPDMVFPATANIICDKVGIKNALSFDINAACSGFIFTLATAAQFIETGKYKKVIVYGGDKDRTTCIIFGDGGGAVLLEPNEEGLGVLDSILRTDGSGRAFLHQKAGGSVKPASHATVDAKEHYVYQEGKTVFKFAVTKMADVAAEIMEKNGLTSDSVNYLIPHQANLRIIDATASRAGLGPEKVIVNNQKYGNTTNGTIPICLWEAENKFKKGDNLILAAFGGGFTWGAVYIKWAYNS